MNNNQSVRLKFVFIASMVWIVILALYAINGAPTWADYLGWLIGAILGMLLGHGFAKLVDFEKMQPKDPKMREAQNNPQPQKKTGWTILIPLGVVAGNIIAKFFVPEVGSLITGTIAGLFCATITYITIQVIRARP